MLRHNLPLIAVLIAAVFCAASISVVAGDSPDSSAAAGPDKEKGNGDDPPNGKSPEGGSLSIGKGGKAGLDFADGSSVTVSENSKAKIQREQKGGATWSFISLESGVFNVKTESGPIEYVLPGMNLMGIGTEFQATVIPGPPVTVEIVNKGGAPLVAVDTLTDMQIRIDPGQGIRASIDPGTGAVSFSALPGNSGDLTVETGGQTVQVAPGNPFSSAGPGKGTMRDELEKSVNVNPPTEMWDYRYTVNTGEGGSAEFVMHDGGRAFQRSGSTMSLWSGKDKDKRVSGAKLESGAAGFDIGTGDFTLETDTVTVSGKGVNFTADVGVGVEEYHNLRGEMMTVRSKVEGPSKGLGAELREGQGLKVSRNPDEPGVTFEVTQDTVGEVRFFTPRGRQIFAPPDSTLSFGDKGNTVTASFPSDDKRFTATYPLEEVPDKASTVSIPDAGSAIDKPKNPSP